MNIGRLMITYPVSNQEFLDPECDFRKAKLLLEIWESVQHKKGVIALIKVCESAQLLFFGGDEPEDYKKFDLVFLNHFVKADLEELFTPSFEGEK